MASRAGQLSGGQRQVATVPGSACTHQDFPTRWPTEHAGAGSASDPKHPRNSQRWTQGAAPRRRSRYLQPDAQPSWLLSPYRYARSPCPHINTPRGTTRIRICVLTRNAWTFPYTRYFCIPLPRLPQVFPESPDLPSDPALSTFIHCLEKKKLLVPATQT